jgi:FkbM family methyltransferase
MNFFILKKIKMLNFTDLTKRKNYLKKITDLLGFYGTAKYIIASIIGKKITLVNLKKYRHAIYIRPNSSDIRVAYEIFMSGELDFIWPYTMPPARIIDAGANAGYATIGFALRWPNSEIIALEPDKENFELARKNIPNKILTHIFQEGIWFENKKLKVRAGSEQMGSWALIFEPADDDDLGAVNSTSIPELLARVGWDQCDLLKIDIEGAETEIFRRDVSWLGKVKSVLIEPHGDEARSLILRAASSYNMTVTEVGEKLFLYQK